MRHKFFQKALCLAITSIMTLTLAACGEGGSSSGGSSSGGSSSGGGANNPIKIGVVLDQTGDLSVYGLSAIAGMRVAVDEINEGGGLLGRNIELVLTDSQTDISVTQQMASKLISEGCDVIIGGVTSASREAIRPMMDEAEQLYFYPVEYEGGVADHYTFCTGPLCAEQSVWTSMDLLVPQYEDCKIYVVAPDYNFGQIMALYVENKVNELGATIVGEEFAPLGTSDFSSTISNITTAKPDIVIFMPAGASMSAFYTQWAKEGIAGTPIITHSSLITYYEHKTMEVGTLTGVYVCAPYVEEFTTDAAIAFTEKVKPILEEYGIPYGNEQASYGYDNIRLYAAAVELAGTTDTEAVIAALETGKVTIEGPSGTITMRGEDHQTSRDMTLVTCDETNTLQIVSSSENQYSTYIEECILEEFGVEGGLAGLAAAGKEAPNSQYIPDVD